MISSWMQELHAAMRRAGQNPTESEVQDMINSVRYSFLMNLLNNVHSLLDMIFNIFEFFFKIQVDVDGSGFVEFPEFCNLMHKKIRDADTENELKETFRVFSKDNEGEKRRCQNISANFELKDASLRRN